MSSDTVGVFIRVTDETNKCIDRIIEKSSIIKDCKSKGHSIDRSVLARFGLLYLAQNLNLLVSKTDLLLAASKAVSTQELFLNAEERIKK